jgi:hypothetical protein
MASSKSSEASARTSIPRSTRFVAILGADQATDRGHWLPTSLGIRAIQEDDSGYGDDVVDMLVPAGPLVCVVCGAINLNSAKRGG